MKKTFKYLGLLLLAAMLNSSARAEIGFGDVWGVAWKIGDIIVGETTLTPAYAVETWLWSFKQTGLGTPVSQTKKVKRSRVTGTYFYSSVDNTPGALFPSSTAPFPVDTIERLTLNCKHNIGTEANPHWVVDIVTATATEFVWLAKVVHTGLWPDDGPWTVWLKSTGTTSKCDPATPTSKNYWVSAELKQSGGQSVSLGNPNCRLDYPFYLGKEFY